MEHSSKPMRGIASCQGAAKTPERPGEGILAERTVGVIVLQVPNASGTSRSLHESFVMAVAGEPSRGYRLEALNM
jgi:hypothetical protein